MVTDLVDSGSKEPFGHTENQDLKTVSTLERRGAGCILACEITGLKQATSTVLLNASQTSDEKIKQDALWVCHGYHFRSTRHPVGKALDKPNPYRTNLPASQTEIQSRCSHSFNVHRKEILGDSRRPIVPADSRGNRAGV